MTHTYKSLIVGKFLTCCLITLTGCAASTERTLNAQEVKTLFSGKTASAYHELQKAPVSLYYDTNGQVRGIFASGKKGSTQWRVADNGNICLQVQGKDTCFAVVEKNGKYQKQLIKAGGQQVAIFSMESFTDGNIHQY